MSRAERWAPLLDVFAESPGTFNYVLIAMERTVGWHKSAEWALLRQRMFILDLADGGVL